MRWLVYADGGDGINPVLRFISRGVHIGRIGAACVKLCRPHLITPIHQFCALDQAWLPSFRAAPKAGLAPVTILQ